MTDRAVLIHGDALQAISTLAGESIDSIVTDPPAGIAFMGKGWDSNKGGRDNWVAWLRDIMREALRVLKPGGHALVWALPRTSHWTATALEDAGFEIRDVVTHLFGTGFPKSLTSASVEIPDDAGTALKPASEHWILCRKPLVGTVAENFARYGTGVLNIGACRIEGKQGPDRSLGPPRRADNMALGAGNPRINPQSPLGRWPANVTLDDDAAALLDAQSGTRTGAHGSRGGYARGAGVHAGGQREGGGIVPVSTGGASRFFYVAKGARAEKDAGLEHLPARAGGDVTGREDGAKGLDNPRAGAGRTGGARNHHPTVKSIALMRWLVRLITPPGGVVLDMFAGSGTTGVAALAEGCRFVGVEMSPEYIPILEGRIAHALGAA